jgi:hypothetical protein
MNQMGLCDAGRRQLVALNSRRIREARAPRVASIAMVVLVSACASLKDTYHPPQRPGAEYDALYPQYIQLCAVSQIRAKFTKVGGSPGHAVMYLHGACKDDTYPYPRLKLCDADSQQTGVGISVNKTFRNVNWMAVPGKALFFYGNLKPGQFLEADQARGTIQNAADEDVFEGIEIHEQYEPPRDDPEALEYFLASETLGTDFALTFGRNAYCANMPVTKPVLSDIVAYLNDLNDQYARGEATYNWSGYSDNCVHTLRNALASGSVWSPKSINQIKLLQLFHLAVPANEFAELAFRTNRFNIEDFDRVYEDPHMREALLRYGWLPARHGALLEYIPVHLNNVIYDVRYQIFVLEAPLFRLKSRRIGKMFDDLRYTDMEANLRYYHGLYDRIMRKRPSNWDHVTEGDPRSFTRRAYYQYIAAQLADVERKLQQLDGNVQATQARFTR